MTHQDDNRDRDLLKRVHTALLYQTESAGINVHVGGGGGRIVLSGIVDTLAEKVRCAEIARRQAGVTTVENGITVAMEDQLDDKAIASEVTDRLAHDDETRNVSAKVKRGRVELVGHVGSPDGEAEAIRIAQGSPSVREVTSRVVLGGGTGMGGRDMDAQITRAAEGVLHHEGYKEGEWEVYCVGQVLHVKGFVSDNAERRRLIHDLQHIVGVNRVEATIVSADEMLDVPPGQGEEQMGSPTPPA